MPELLKVSMQKSIQQGQHSANQLINDNTNTTQQSCVQNAMHMARIYVVPS